MITYIVDSYSWMDYFDGNSAGKEVKKYIENSSFNIVTNILCIAEIMSAIKRKKGNFEEAYKSIVAFSKVYSFDHKFSMESGLLHAEIKEKVKNFGLIDAFVLNTARKLNAKIITGDKHFKGLKEAILIS